MNMTSIQALYDTLKPGIFTTQHIFYSVIINLTLDLDALFLNKMREILTDFEANRDLEQLRNNTVSFSFYEKLVNIHKKSAYKEYYPRTSFSNGMDNSARSAVNKIMRKDGAAAIRLQWRKRYYNSNRSDEYRATLSTVLKYYIALCHPEILHLDSSKPFDLSDKIWEDIDQKLKKNCFPFSPRHDFKGLIDLIAEHLWTQCQNVPESSLMAQWEKYQTYINCYGARTIDKFNALVENAKDNVYCACELGDIYYYGYTFYSSSTFSYSCRKTLRFLCSTI